MEIIKLADTPVQTVIKKTCEVLAAGGLVIFPTETTYGAGVDATNPAAVEKLLQYKSRREGKPLSIAVTSLKMAEQYVAVNDQARTLYKQFLPGPVTVVSKDLGVVAPGVASEFGTVGVRIPDYELLLELLEVYGKPITATSANGSGLKRPYAITDIFTTISDKQKKLIDLVLDAGTLPTNPPSTVIDTTLSTPITLRAGSIVLQAAQSDQTRAYVDQGGTTASGAMEAKPSYQLTSANEAETKSIAGRLVLKNWNAVGTTGLVIGLDGPLGAGKTVFAKGVAEFLQINALITSPTYGYVEEYDFTRHQTTGKFYHLDMWKVDSKELFEKLELPESLQPGTVMVVEWWSQVAEFFTPFLDEQKITYLSIQISEDAGVTGSKAASTTHLESLENNAPVIETGQRRMYIQESAE